MDNVFIERLWRKVKYEEVYLKGYESIGQAKKGAQEHYCKSAFWMASPF